MKYIKLFEDFSKLNENVQIDEKNEYVQLVAKGQNLEIKLVARGEDLKGFQKTHKQYGERCFYDYFESIDSNSDFKFLSDASQIGYMSDAPCIAYALNLDDYGDFTETDDTKVWYWDLYMTTDFVKELLTKKSVVFTLAD
jgi:hypothetical protein